MIENTLSLDWYIYFSCFGTLNPYSKYTENFVNNESCQDNIRKSIFYFFYIFGPLGKFWLASPLTVCMLWELKDLVGKKHKTDPVQLNYLKDRNHGSQIASQSVEWCDFAIMIGLTVFVK